MKITLKDSADRVVAEDSDLQPLILRFRRSIAWQNQDPFTTAERVELYLAELQAYLARRRFPGRQRLVRETVARLAAEWEALRPELVRAWLMRE